jgi:hypothetical protein
MNYQTYDELVSLVRELRSNLKEYSRVEQDKIIRKTLKISQVSILEIDGTSDLINFGEALDTMSNN